MASRENDASDRFLERETKDRGDELYQEYYLEAVRASGRAREIFELAKAVDANLRALAVPENKFLAELHRRKLEGSSRELASYRMRFDEANRSLGDTAANALREKAARNAKAEFIQTLFGLPILTQARSGDCGDIIRRLVQLPNGRVVLVALRVTSKGCNQFLWATDSPQQFGDGELEVAAKAVDKWEEEKTRAALASSQVLS